MSKGGRTVEGFEAGETRSGLHLGKQLLKEERADGGGALRGGTQFTKHSTPKHVRMGPTTRGHWPPTFPTGTMSPISSRLILIKSRNAGKGEFPNAPRQHFLPHPTPNLSEQACVCLGPRIHPSPWPAPAPSPRSVSEPSSPHNHSEWGRTDGGAVSPGGRSPSGNSSSGPWNGNALAAPVTEPPQII